MCMGTENKKIIEAFKSVVPIIIETASAEEAVQAAYGLGKMAMSFYYHPLVQVSICLKTTKTVVANSKQRFVIYN